MSKTIYSLLIALYVGCFASLSARALDTIPQDLLDLDYARCNKDCVPGFGEKACHHLCKCSVDEFAKRLDYSKYLDLSVQLSKGEMTPATQKVLDNVAQYCSAELDKAGIMLEPQTATKAE